MKKTLDFLKNTIKINNSSISLSNINSSNYSVFVNDTIIGNCEIDKEIKITLNGNLDSLDVACGDIAINGDVLGKVTSTNGDINIEGFVSSNVFNTNGNINISQNVGGTVKTINGDIKYKK